MQLTWFSFELLNLQRGVKFAKGFLASCSKIVQVIMIALRLFTFTT